MSLVMTSSNFIIIGYNYLTITLFCLMLLLIDIEYINHQCLLPSSAMALDIEVTPATTKITSDTGQDDEIGASTSRFYLAHSGNIDRQQVARMISRNQPPSKFSREFNTNTNHNHNHNHKNHNININDNNDDSNQKFTHADDYTSSNQHKNHQKPCLADGSGQSLPTSAAGISSGAGSSFQPTVVKNNHQQNNLATIQRLMTATTTIGSNDDVVGANLGSKAQNSSEMKRTITEDAGHDHLVVETAEKLISQLTNHTTSIRSNSTNFDPVASIDGFDLELVEQASGDTTKSNGDVVSLGKGVQYLIASSVVAHFSGPIAPATDTTTSASASASVSANMGSANETRANSSSTSYHQRHYSQSGGKYANPILINSLYANSHANTNGLNYMHGPISAGKSGSLAGPNSLVQAGVSGSVSHEPASAVSSLAGGAPGLAANDNNRQSQLVASNNVGPQQHNGTGPFSCGRQQVTRESKIVGGNNTYEGEFPWAVSIQRHGNHHCGGVIVGRRWILTAAHCVRSQLVNNLVVRVGGHNLLRANQASQTNHLVRDYIVEQIIIHEDFSRYDHLTMAQTKSSANTNNADIALLRLKQDIVWNEHAWPVCFPSKESGNFAGHDAVVIGWGKLSEKSEDFSNDLQKVRLTIIDNKVCQNWFRQAGRDMPIDDRIICAGYRNGGKDACHGDSGGPLLSRINGHYVVVGVVSTGIGCARPLLPGLYSRVSSYVTWMEKYVLA